MAITTETKRITSGPTCYVNAIPFTMTLKATIDDDGFASDEVECTIGDIVFTASRTEVTEAVMGLGPLAPTVQPTIGPGSSGDV
jgi:hypothetical protein